MKLWEENKISNEKEVSHKDISDGYFKSRYAELDMPFERKLRLYIGSADGMNSSFDEPDFPELMEFVWRRR